MDTLPVGHPDRRAAARALWLNGVVVAVFMAFAAVSTQAKGVRQGSPWQDDPYDGVVSFTVFLVPALAALVAARAGLSRRRVLEPVYRVEQLLRAALIGGVLVAATAVTDWLAVALRADRPLWNMWTPWLIVALAVVTAAAVAALLVAWRAWRHLPARADGDWLADVPLTRLAAFVRQHIVAVAALASLAAGLSVTMAEAVGESWTSPLLFVTATAIGAGGFFAFSMAGNALLRIAARPATGGRIRRALGLATVLGGAALPVAAVLRDSIWSALGLSGAVDSPDRFAAVTFGGGLVVASVTFVATLLYGRFPRCPAKARPKCTPRWSAASAPAASRPRRPH